MTNLSAHAHGMEGGLAFVSFKTVAKGYPLRSFGGLNFIFFFSFLAFFFS